MQKSINSSIWNFQIRLRRIRNFPLLNHSFQSIFSSFNSVKSMGSSESRSDSPIGIASNSPPPAANHPLHHGQDYSYHQHSVRKLSWPKTLFAWRAKGKSITPRLVLRELRRYKDRDTIRCFALEVPEHCQEQLISAFVEKAPVIIIPKIGGARALLRPTPLVY